MLDFPVRYCACGCGKQIATDNKLRKYFNAQHKNNKGEQARRKKKAFEQYIGTERALGTVLLRLVAEQPISMRDREKVRRLGHMLQDGEYDGKKRVLM